MTVWYKIVCLDYYNVHQIIFHNKLIIYFQKQDNSSSSQMSPQLNPLTS